MKRSRWYVALFAPLWLILLTIVSPAQARGFDAVEGVHFTTVSRSSAIARVRINRHIIDTRQFAESFGTNMFRIRTENPANTLALCRVNGVWKRARVRPDFIEADRASNAYWDEHCPNEADRYVYLIPGETLVMSINASLGDVGVMNPAADVQAAPSADAGTVLNADAGMAVMGDPLAAQIAACTTPSCVWALVSPLAPNVKWSTPGASSDSLTAQIKDCDTQRCVLDLVIPLSSNGIEWRNIIASPNTDTAGQVIDTATFTGVATVPSALPSASPVLVTHTASVVSSSSGSEEALKAQVNQARVGFGFMFVLAIVALGMLIYTVIRNRREVNSLRGIVDADVQGLREKIQRRDEHIGTLTKENAQVLGRAVEAELRVAALERESVHLSAAHRREVEIADQNLIALQERTSNRNAITLRTMNGLCARFGLESVDSVEEGAKRLGMVIGRIEDILKRDLSRASVDAVHLKENRSYTFEELVDHVVRALPSIEKVLAGHREGVLHLQQENLSLTEEVTQLRRENLKLKESRGGDSESWGEQFRRGAQAFLDSNRSSDKPIALTEEEFAVLQALVNAARVRALRAHDNEGNEVSVFIQEPPSPSVRPSALRVVPKT